MDVTLRQSIAIVAIIAVLAACIIGYIAYQTRNITPYDRDTQQYEGWMYAEYNQFKDAGQCEDKDGGWAALGVETSAEFVAGCREWFKLK